MSDKKSKDRNREREHPPRDRQSIADACGCFSVVDACGCRVVDPCGCYVSQCC